jgi:hypothetical protein
MGCLICRYLIKEWEHQAEKDGPVDSFQNLKNEDFAIKKILVVPFSCYRHICLFLHHASVLPKTITEREEKREEAE